MTDPAVRIRLKTRWTFEGRRIEDRLEKKNIVALTKFGSYSRQRVRRKMNKKGGGRRGHSEPGQPPRNIMGFLRDSAKYVVDDRANTVTNLLPQQFERTTADVPAILEYGGDEQLRLGILFSSPDGKNNRIFSLDQFSALSTEQQRDAGRDAGGRFRKRKLIHLKIFKPVTVHYEPRPALEPTFEEMLEKHGPGGPSDLWEDLL